MQVELVERCSEGAGPLLRVSRGSDILRVKIGGWGHVRYQRQYLILWAQESWVQESRSKGQGRIYLQLADQGGRASALSSLCLVSNHRAAWHSHAHILLRQQRLLMLRLEPFLLGPQTPLQPILLRFHLTSAASSLPGLVGHCARTLLSSFLNPSSSSSSERMGKAFVYPISSHSFSPLLAAWADRLRPAELDSACGSALDTAGSSAFGSNPFSCLARLPIGPKGSMRLFLDPSKADDDAASADGGFLSEASRSSSCRCVGLTDEMGREGCAG